MRTARRHTPAVDSSAPATRPSRAVLAVVALATLGAGYDWGGAAGRGYRALRAGKADEAVAAFEEARREDPSSALVRYDQGLAYRAAGNADSARAALRDAQRLDGAAARSSAAYNLANEALRDGRLHDAIEGYRRALREDPARVDAKRNLEEAIRRARAASTPPQTGDAGALGAGEGGSGRRSGGATPPGAGAEGEPRTSPSSPPRDDRSLGAAAPSREEAEHWLDALEAERRASRAREQALRRASEEGRSDRDW